MAWASVRQVTDRTDRNASVLGGGRLEETASLPGPFYQHAPPLLG